MDKKIKICIGIPTNRGIKPKTALSLLNLDIPYEKHVVIATEGYTISENRTYLVLQALKNKCTHILMVDDDMVFPENTLKKLLENDKKIIGVLAHSRTLIPLPVVEFIDDNISEGDKLLGKREIPTETFEVKAIGGGILLIDLSIFEKIEKPYFDTETLDNGFTKMGEDSWFCKQAKNAGYKIWCDPSLKIGHIGDYVF